MLIAYFRYKKDAGFDENIGKVFVDVLEFYWDYFDPTITCVSIADNK